MRLILLLLALVSTVASASFWKPFGPLELAPAAVMASLSKDGTSLVTANNNESSSVELYHYQDGEWTRLWTLDNSETQLLQVATNNEPVTAIRTSSRMIQVVRLLGDDDEVEIRDFPDVCISLQAELHVGPSHVVVACENTLQVFDIDNYDADALPLVLTLPRRTVSISVDWYTTSNVRLFRMVVIVTAADDDVLSLRVRVYDVLVNGGLVKIGDDVVVHVSEEEAATPSVSLSSTSDSILAIGSTSGEVFLYHYKRTFSKTASWKLLSKLDIAFTTDGSDLSFNQVFLSRDANRLVVSGGDTTRIYDRSNDKDYVLQSQVSGTTMSTSETGSILVVVSSNESHDNMQLLIDESSHCSSATTSDFYERWQCRDGNELIQSEDICETTTSHGVPCVWLVNPTPEPSSSPSSPAPTARPSLIPTPDTSLAPTAVSTESESHAGSVQPTAVSAKTALPTVAQEPTTFSLEGCVCDNYGVCMDGPLKKGSKLGVCVQGTNNARLLGVTDFRLQRGNDDTIVIDDNGLRIPGAQYTCAGDFCQIQTPVEQEVFDSTSEDRSLLASGTIVVLFQQRRWLVDAMAEDGMNGDFSVVVQLDAVDEYEDELMLSAGFWAVLIIMVLLVMGCCFCLVRRKKRSQRGDRPTGRSFTFTSHGKTK